MQFVGNIVPNAGLDSRGQARARNLFLEEWVNDKNYSEGNNKMRWNKILIFRYAESFNLIKLKSLDFKMSLESFKLLKLNVI